MLKRISHTFIYVLDQDEALDFYAGKLGMVVHSDADLGTDCALRDPFGNPLRFTQPPDGPIVVPPAPQPGA